MGEFLKFSAYKENGEKQQLKKNSLKNVVKQVFFKTQST